MHNQSQKLLLYQNTVFNKDLSLSEFIVPASASVQAVRLITKVKALGCYSSCCRFSRSTREDIVSAVGPDLIKWLVEEVWL